jgi:hypothetical protein
VLTTPSQDTTDIITEFLLLVKRKMKKMGIFKREEFSVWICGENSSLSL